MAVEIHVFQVTIPAGTLKGTPQKTTLTMPPREVNKVVIRVPPGPRGEVGFALGSSGVAVFPREAGTFVVTDDEVIPWDVESQWNSGSWQLFGYNTGSFDHTIEIRFHVSLTGGTDQGPQPLAVTGPAAAVAPALTPALPGLSLPPPPGPP